MHHPIHYRTTQHICQCWRTWSKDCKPFDKNVHVDVSRLTSHVSLTRQRSTGCRNLKYFCSDVPWRPKIAFKRNSMRDSINISNFTICSFPMKIAIWRKTQSINNPPPIRSGTAKLYELLHTTNNTLLTLLAHYRFLNPILSIVIVFSLYHPSAILRVHYSTVVFKRQTKFQLVESLRCPSKFPASSQLGPSSQ